MPVFSISSHFRLQMGSFIFAFVKIKSLPCTVVTNLKMIHWCIVILLNIKLQEGLRKTNRACLHFICMSLESVSQSLTDENMHTCYLFFFSSFPLHITENITQNMNRHFMGACVQRKPNLYKNLQHCEDQSLLSSI